MNIGWRYICWSKGDDLYILQLKWRGPLFAIIRTYFSEDAGMNLIYTRYAIPKKYITEPPL